MKRNNKNGFTLIEMLGVIVIIGLIMIVAIPTMSKLINSNKNQEYSTYYSTVEEAAIAYSTKLEDKLGNSTATGCAEVDLQTLIDEGYISEYSSRDVVCSTTVSGVNNKIKIRNNKGKITVKFRLVCTDTDKNEIVYDTGPSSTDANACDAYALDEEINIKTQLDSDDSLTKVSGSSSNITYIGGTNPNNYIWYSGKLWRVVSYNSSTDVVKAVTANPMTSIYFNSNKESSFNNSDVEIWLNNQFLSTLKDQQQFIVSYNWNYTANSDMSVDSNNSASNKKLKVGLINSYEYGKIKDWYGASQSWLLSEGTGSNSLYTDGSNKQIKSAASDQIRSIRPTIVFSSDVLVYKGNGTASNPYIIDNNSNAEGKDNELINTRYSGEYVSLNGKKYRIVSTDGITTKIISTFSVGTYDFDAPNAEDDGFYLYSTSNIKTSLETYYSGVSSYLTNGDFCMDTINGSNVTYRSAACLTPARLITTKVGLPKIGDIFTTNLPGVTSSYWTINPNTEQSYSSIINLIDTNGMVSTTNASISNTNATVSILYLDSSIKIASGKGTNETPYVLKK